MFTDSSDCRLPTARMSVVDVVARALVVSTGTPCRGPFGSCAKAEPASKRVTWMPAAIAVMAMASATAVTADFTMEAALLTPRPQHPDPTAVTLSQKKRTTIRQAHEYGR